MKKLRAGLVVEGNSTSSAILRLPSVVEDLGPVKSGSLQVARRVSNFLRAGYAVTSYSELSAARIILIRVPDAAVARVVEDICASELNLNNLSVVLCETWMQTEVLQPLRERGAFIASVVAVSQSKRDCFAVEGDTQAVRQMRHLVERGEVKTVELRAGAKHLFFAAVMLLTAIPLPILTAAQQALRESGVAGNQLSVLLEDLADGTISRFLRSPKVAAGVGPAECSQKDSDAYLARLRLTHPDLAAKLANFMTLATTPAEKPDKTKGHVA